MDQGQGARLKELIAKYVLKYNYWGYLFSRIRRVPKLNFGSIMGVGANPDGTISLFYDPTLCKGTTDDQMSHVLEHEGMHVLNKHLVRTLRIVADTPGGAKAFQASGKARIWNIAMDCAVNTQAKIPDPLMINGKAWHGCYPKSYELEDGYSAEWYYYTLLKKAKKESIPGFGGKCPNCGGTGKDEFGEQCPCQDPNNKGQGSGQGDGPEGYGSHDEWFNTNGVTDVHSLSTKVGHHIADIVKESVKTFSKDRGTLPGHIQELVKEALAPPKVPYFQIIRRLVRGTRLSKFKRSFTKINRKRTYVFIINPDGDEPEISPFPGRTRDFTFKIVILIDTSGSQSKEDIMEALAGVKSIIEGDRYCYTTVLEVDTCVQKEYEVKRLHDIQFNIQGRGGTVLQPGLERARELNCDICLTFTDGGTDAINRLPRKMLPKKNVFVIGERSGSSAQLEGAGYIVRVPGM